jgi:hypothetical protein
MHPRHSIAVTDTEILDRLTRAVQLLVEHTTEVSNTETAVNGNTLIDLYYCIEDIQTDMKIRMGMGEQW